MSTEADIVETLNVAWVADALEAGHIRSTIVAERMIRGRQAALTEITNLRAERDAAVRETIERCAKAVEGDARSFDFQQALAECRDSDAGYNRGRLDGAAMIRALAEIAAPADPVIAMEGDSHG